MRNWRPALGMLVCGLTAHATLAREVPPQFVLGRFVPGDVWMYVNAARNPERAWLCREYAQIFEALRTSGIEEDLSALILSWVDGPSRQQVAQSLARISAAVRRVAWSDLIHEEYAVAERAAGGSRLYEYLLLGRGRKGAADRNISDLVDILRAFAEMAGSKPVIKEEGGGISRWRVAFADHDEALTVSLLRRGDVIGVVIGASLARDTVRLMRQGDGADSIRAAARFRKALAQVPPPENQIMFFDLRRLVGDIRRLVARGLEGRPDVPATAVVVVESVLELLDVVDYSIVTDETVGMRDLSHSATRLRQDKLHTPLAKAVFDRKPIRNFDRCIPADAVAFSVSTTVDFGTIYHALIRVLKQESPRVQARLAKWNRLLAAVGFDPDRDLFSWLSGEIVTVELPEASPLNRHGTGTVVMFRVKDADLAATKIRSAIDKVKRFIDATGAALHVTEADVRQGGFVQLTYPPAAMFVRPVIGVSGNWLMFGSSDRVVDRCLGANTGCIARISKNERYRNEGVIPTGPVLAASFRDTSRRADEMAEIAGLVGMVGGMSIAGVPEKPEKTKIRLAVQTLLAVVVKLGPVFHQFDFYASESSVTTRHGNMLRTESITTYRGSEPPAGERENGKQGGPPPPRPPQGKHSRNGPLE